MKIFIQAVFIQIFYVCLYASDEISCSSINPNSFDKIIISIDFKDNVSQRRLYFKVTENGRPVDFKSIERPLAQRKSQFSNFYEIYIIPNPELGIIYEKKLYDELAKIVNEDVKKEFLNRKPDGILLNSLGIKLNKLGS